MKMVPFYSKFPKIAEKETRSITIVDDSVGLKKGEYGFLELFCNDQTCDCRRAMVQVISPEGKFYATLSYGWESLEFYTKWMYGDKEIAKDMIGAQLYSLAPQTNDSEKFLGIFRSMLEDPAYANRIKSHYELFKNIKPKKQFPLSEKISTNESWIFHREEIDTIQDGTCNIYVLLDGATGHCYGQEACNDLPAPNSILEILKNAHRENKKWPKQIYVSKKDPYIESFKAICNGLKITVIDLPTKDFKPLVKDFSDSFIKFKMGDNQQKHAPLSEEDQRELDAFIPDSYGPCPCASGKKFKFCCKSGFKEIAFAMCAAQDGFLQEALGHMQEAELKMGTTPEVQCRYAICWSFFDREKTAKYLAEAVMLNPNHPRTNYILGIEAVEKNKYDEAIVYYQKAIDNYPAEDIVHLNETYNNQGTAYYKLKNYIKSKEVWEKALLLLPTDRTVKNNLIECIYDNPDVPKNIREMSPFVKKYLKREGVLGN